MNESRIENYAGYWTGTFEGTNGGGVSFEITQVGKKISGTATMQEPAFGVYQYALEGTAGTGAQFNLTPIQKAPHVELGSIKAVVSRPKDGKITGRWASTLGTNGIFSAQRHEADRGSSTKVFIVHGHDEAAKLNVARFLERLGLAPVILQEQVSAGRTVLEKFEDHAKKAGFAVILVTPDDVGYPVAHEEKRKFRPRQNVVLELGYFAAFLGRERTFVLVKGEVEFPSDILGLVYEKMDQSEGWKISLVKELRSAGYAVDLNKAIG